MKRKTIRTFFLAAVAALGLSSPANAFAPGLYIDLRVTSVSGPATTDGANSVQVTGPGARIEMDIWGRVEGWNNHATDDALQLLSGSIISSSPYWNDQRVLGTLQGSNTPGFDAFLSSPGMQVDLDGDGDLDIGSYDDASAANFFTGRSGPWPATGNLLRVGQVSFTVDQITSAVGFAEINFRPRFSSNAASWIADEYLQIPQEPYFDNYRGGYGVSVSAIPEPGALGMLAAVATFASALRPQKRN